MHHRADRGGERYVGDLDAVVGDDDAGYSLAPGSRRSSTGGTTSTAPTVGPFLKKTGMIIISRIGGTSGPMWGTAFLKAGVSAGSNGDKALLDVLAPMTDRIEQELQAGAPSAQVVSAAAETARQAAKATSELVAMRGRASYSGERSKGSVDAGAMGVAVIVESISRAWPTEGAS